MVSPTAQPQLADSSACLSSSRLRCRRIARSTLKDWHAFVAACALERAVRHPWLRLGLHALRAHARARREERARAEEAGRAALLSHALRRLRQGARAAKAAALAAEALRSGRDSTLLLRCVVLWQSQCRLRDAKGAAAERWQAKRIGTTAFRKWRAHHVRMTIAFRLSLRSAAAPA